MEMFLIGIIFVLIGVILFMAIKGPKVIEISDVAPEKDSLKNRGMKFQNEGGKYVRLEDGKVKLKVVK